MGLNVDGKTGYPREPAYKIAKIVAVSASALLIWFARDVVLLTFAGILCGVGLRALSAPVSRLTRLPAGLSVALAALLLVGVFAGLSWLVAPPVNEQLGRMGDLVPKTVASIRESVKDWPVIGPIARGRGGFLPNPQTLIEHAGGVIITTVGFFGGIAYVAFLGLFLALQPQLYVNGFLRLLPFQHRGRTHEVLQQSNETLKWWLIGRVADMAFIGTVTAIGLTWLGVEVALGLALIAAILTFIPYIGPALSWVPAVLVAFSQSPRLALWVTIFYFILQNIDDDILNPIIQRKMTRVPPALTLVGQLLFGLAAGVLGVFVASPILAAALVVTRVFYVEDVLGDKGQQEKKPARAA